MLGAPGGAVAQAHLHESPLGEGGEVTLRRRARDADALGHLGRRGLVGPEGGEDRLLGRRPGERGALPLAAKDGCRAIDVVLREGPGAREQVAVARVPVEALREHARVEGLHEEGERTRVQAYEGVCIARTGGGINESFTVRKISYGEGVERVFPIYSPNIDSIKVTRRGKVRRAKLYYLRDRRGKSARIAERAETPAAKAAREAAKKEAKSTAKAAKAKKSTAAE